MMGVESIDDTTVSPLLVDSQRTWERCDDVCVVRVYWW